MTITSFPARNEYTATAGQTVFNYTFKIYTDSDLQVFVTPAGQSANDSTDEVTGFSVTGVLDENGGAVTLVSPTSSGDLVTIVSNIPDNRTTDYQFNGDFIPSTVNEDFDRSISLVKQANDLLNRTLVTEKSLQGASPLSLPVPQAGYAMRWKTDLSGLENIPLTGASLSIPVIQLSSYADLSTALVAIGSTETELWIDKSDVTINAPLTIPSNVKVVHFKPYLLDGTSTLTINGDYTSGYHKIFGDNITVTFNNDEGNIKAAWFGFDPGAIAVDNDAAISKAMSAAQNVIEERNGTFLTSATIEFKSDHQTLTLSPGTFISYSGTGFAVLFEGVNRCRLNGWGRITTTNLSGNGIKFAPTSTLQCRNNAAYASLITGKGGPSSAGFAASGTAGIFFSRVIGVGGAFFNRVYADRVSGYNTGVVFDAPGGNPANGPNGSATFGIDHDDYWFGYRFEGAECMVYGGFANSAAGTVTNDTTFLDFSNGSLFNMVNGVIGEPGAFAIPYRLDAGCNNNVIDGNFGNFSKAGVDNGTENWIKTGRNAYYPHISFPATQVPIADPNTLDDYEEGSFTFALEFGGLSTGITYDNNSGFYTKVGNKVSAVGYLNLSNKGTATGNARITGLPFVCKNNANAVSPAAIQIELISFTDIVQAFINFNTDELFLFEVTNAGTRTQLDDTNFGNDSRIFFSVTYFTD